MESTIEYKTPTQNRIPTVLDMLKCFMWDNLFTAKPKTLKRNIFGLVRNTISSISNPYSANSKKLYRQGHIFGIKIHLIVSVNIIKFVVAA